MANRMQPQKLYVSLSRELIGTYIEMYVNTEMFPDELALRIYLNNSDLKRHWAFIYDAIPHPYSKDARIVSLPRALDMVRSLVQESALKVVS